jgi:hypothetical protein
MNDRALAALLGLAGGYAIARAMADQQRSAADAREAPPMFQPPSSYFVGLAALAGDYMPAAAPVLRAAAQGAALVALGHCAHLVTDAQGSRIAHGNPPAGARIDATATGTSPADAEARLRAMFSQRA